MARPTPKPIEVRPARPEDEEAALALLEELFEPPGRRPPDYSRERGRQGFRFALQNPDADILLAFEGDSLVGLASLYAEFPSMRFGRRCYLEDLVVTGPRRSHGVGRLLLDAASEWARQHGCNHLELDSGHARKEAHRFYLREGMAQDGLIFSRWLE